MKSRPWLATYRDNHIPETIDANAYPSVVHMLEQAMTMFAGKAAFRAMGQTLTYADVDRLSAAFAAWLQNQLGVKKGDHIAVMSPNLLAFPVAFLGIARAGAVQVNVNPMYTPRELEHQLNDSGSKIIVIFSGSPFWKLPRIRTACSGDVGSRPPMSRITSPSLSWSAASSGARTTSRPLFVPK